MIYKLGDCIEKIIDNRGRNPKYYDKEMYPVIDNVMIKNNYYPDIKESTRYIDKDTHDNFLRGYIEKDMPIMTLVGGGIGNVALAPNSDSVIVQNTIGFKTKDNILDSKYLYYWFISRKDEIVQFNRGSGQPSIRKTDIEGMNIELPSLDVQKRVSKLLSILDDKILLNNEINNNLLQLGLEQIKHISTEDYDCLGNFATIISKGTTPTGKDMSDNEDRSIKFIKVRDFNDYGINTTELEYIPEIIHTGRLKRSILASKDLLVSIAGTLGRVAIVTDELDGSNTNQAVAFVRLKDVKNLGYLYFYAKGSKFQYEIEKRQVHAVQPNLSLSELSSIDVPLIEEEQKDLYNVLLNKIISNLEMNNKLSQLRDTLLPKLMNGEIDLDSIEI